MTPFEQGEIAPDLFWAACRIGIEDLISKRRKCTYKGSWCEHSIKLRNECPRHSAE